MVTVQHEFHFTGLPVYAPNGSEYIYTITEDTSQLGGFVTWAAEGAWGADQVKDEGAQTNVVTGLVADDGPVYTIDATFLNEPEADPDPIQLRPVAWAYRYAGAQGQRPDRTEQRH